MVRSLSHGFTLSILLGGVVLGLAAPAFADRGERYGDDRRDYRPESWRDDRRHDDARDRGRDRHDLSRFRGRDYDHDDRDKNRHVHVDVRLGDDPFPRPPVIERHETRVWVEPVYRTVVDRAWVEPAYRTAYERVWHEPVYREEHERIWVPDRWELRETVCYDSCGRRIVRTERVLLEPAHWEVRRHRVLVCEGRWETVERRELVCEGFWKTIERQELVSPGRWEYHTEHVAVDDRGWRDDPLIHIRARLDR